MAASGDRALLKQKWSTLFKKALEADTWGQAIEASDFYAEYALLVVSVDIFEHHFVSACNCASSPICIHLYIHTSPTASHCTGLPPPWSGSKKTLA